MNQDNFQAMVNTDPRIFLALSCFYLLTSEMLLTDFRNASNIDIDGLDIKVGYDLEINLGNLCQASRGILYKIQVVSESN